MAKRKRGKRRRRAERRESTARHAATTPPIARCSSRRSSGSEPTASTRNVRDAAERVEPERQARFAKRVARGDIEPAASVDLHGLDRDQAAARLRRFLSTAAGETVLVIHGRGAGIVRAAALAELDRHPRVAEHLPAPRHLGGDGARLVRLRLQTGAGS